MLNGVALLLFLGVTVVALRKGSVESDQTKARHTQARLTQAIQEAIYGTNALFPRLARQSDLLGGPVPQPQVLHEDTKVKVVVVGLETGGRIPVHAGGAGVYHFLEGAGQMAVGDGFRGAGRRDPADPRRRERDLLAQARLAFIAVRLLSGRQFWRAESLESRLVRVRTRPARRVLSGEIACDRHPQHCDRQQNRRTIPASRIFACRRPISPSCAAWAARRLGDPCRTGRCGSTSAR